MMQLPIERPVIVLPVTEQVAGVEVVSRTGRPDVAVAACVPLLPTVTLGAAPSVMVCGFRAAEMVTVTSAVDEVLPSVAV